MRIGLIAVSALTVTAVTYLIFPEAFIWFGILHLLALGSALSLPLLFAPAFLVAALALVALVLPLVISEPAFDAPLWQWLGLGTHPPITNDWRPLLPWLGAMLLGLLAGRAVAAKGLPQPIGTWQPKSFLGRGFVWGGRHTLVLYLTHQPVLFALVFVGATLTAPREADILGTQSGFMRGCETQCVTTGGEAGLCKRACGCIAQDATDKGMGRAVARLQAPMSRVPSTRASVGASEAARAAWPSGVGCTSRGKRNPRRSTALYRRRSGSGSCSVQPSASQSSRKRAW
jgi:uncharacterized membrane protein